MSPKPPSPRDGLAARAWLAAYEVGGACAVLAAALLWPLLARRGYGTGLAERLGRLSPKLLALPAPPVWIHAASVGEARATRALVRSLRRRHPQIPIVFSTTTVTGRAVAEAELAPDGVTLLPIDALGIVRRALRRVRPRCLVLVETEIWPGLVRAASRMGIPIVMVSGRLSPRAARRYRWAAPLFRAALARVERFGMQTDADAQRIIALGAPSERVLVTGSLKQAALALPVAPLHVSGLESRRLLVAGSTQPGEEAFVLDACRELWAVFDDLLLLIAPRRPERFDEVEDLIARSGLRYQRRSRMDRCMDAGAQVLLLDTVGELPRFYPPAVAVFVGGTVAPMGGHNVLEPAVQGKAVAFGPHTANVADAARALRELGGGAEVRVPQDLADLWYRLLASPSECRRMGRRARAVAASGGDALERNWKIVEPFLRLAGDS